MVDMYQTGIIITFFLVVSGSLVGAIAQQEPGETFGMPIGFGTITTPDGATVDMNTMVESINADFAEAAASSDLLSQVIIGGGALINGLLVIGQVIFNAFTMWIAMVDIMFGFVPAASAVNLFSIPIKIALSLIMIYTLIRFGGDIISHLPFFGGG